ncbi:hypothetical protein MLD38_019764 [Melastoma candidum]|uniref:Uncharacterized protein n=1 Tax=Melastoma candidum TaxID=119954 RepID=A0ACB9R6C4_9MYRT|nr:hypothetical protein MLD38_019764 [Melastoma candidum]
MGRAISERFLGLLCHADGSPRQCSASSPWKHIQKRASRSTATTTTLLLLLFFLVLGSLVFAAWINALQTLFLGASPPPVSLTKRTPKITGLSLSTRQNFTGTSTEMYPAIASNASRMLSSLSTKNECPAYFKWIHEDLKPWRMSGITRDMVERARKTAHFRLAVINGKVYIKKYKPAIQTRDVFTIWGMLQLLRRYPARLPDLELLFDCDDRPVVHAKAYQSPGRRPPPLFRYCGNANTLDIVFPDWSFWGWPEINIKPWTQVLMDIQEGNGRIKWEDRAHFAYWKGNPNVASTRKDLLKCNVTEKYDWNARLYVQDWIQESKQGYQQSNLQDQCTHRYKVYVDGWAWSVSKKYIMACNSTTLLVTPRYYEFFTRGLLPLKHYWPIRENTKCTSLKFAVDWGNNNTKKARSIGEAGSHFIFNELKMDYVYDYMFHLLKEYTKLLRFKPGIPRGAVEVCAERMGRLAKGKHRKYMMESAVNYESRDRVPCSLPAEFDPQSLQAFNRKKVQSIWLVKTWENDYWNQDYAKKGH